jgi:hypothetical protein
MDFSFIIHQAMGEIQSILAESGEKIVAGTNQHQEEY